jgi:5,10-methylenetetrahydromethanopterin reductase
VSIALQTDKPLSDYGPLANAIEGYGFGGVSVYNDMLFQPAWLPLLEIARATQRVRIGPAAVNPFTCHPINIAGHIALLDEAARGRAYLGLARGSWLDYLGLFPQRPVRALREAIDCVNLLLARSTEPYRGEVFQLAGGDSLRWPIERPGIPILLGSWGKTTIRTCISKIDEVKLGGTANPEIVPHYLRLMACAALEAKRRPEEIGLVLGAVCVVDMDGQAARTRARHEAALYLPIIADLDPTIDLEPEQLTRMKAAAKRFDFEQVAALISDEMLLRFVFAGTPDEVIEQAAAVLHQGASRVEFGTPHGLTVASGLRLLGERVLPALTQYLT